MTHPTVLLRLVLATLLTGWLAAQPAIVPPFPEGRGQRLAEEASPYLRQHVSDPIAWWPWNDEALAYAKRTGKPIFLSIGYSSCHWCHVMQRESFRDPHIAKILERSFVPIKVDREERPDLDRIYMEACIRFSQHGSGWPLSAWLTPEGEPFYVGTYYPPQARDARPSFESVLLMLEKGWNEDRENLVRGAQGMVKALAREHVGAVAEELPTGRIALRAAQRFRASEDVRFGGLEGTPKFVRPAIWRLLLVTAARDGLEEQAVPVKRLLEGLLAGGTHDQLGGGFHRYSTDARWRVPHFEKMLYDQARHGELLLDAYLIWKEPAHLEALERTIAWTLTDLALPSGLLASAFDAEIDGAEGEPYAWTTEDLDAALPNGPIQDVFFAWSDIQPEGNWDHGLNIIYEAEEVAGIAARTGANEAEVSSMLALAKRALRAQRTQRALPRRDEKALTEWNALMVALLARAGAALDRPAWIAEAGRIHAAVERELKTTDGGYMRSFASGEAKHRGELTDHAAMLVATLALHEARLDTESLAQAKTIAATLLREFGTSAGGLVDSKAPDLVMRTSTLFDGSKPTGTALTVEGLARLHVLTGDREHRTAAEGIVRAARERLEARSTESPHLLIALDQLIGPTIKLSWDGPVPRRGKDSDAPAIWTALQGRYQPFLAQTVVPSAEGQGTAAPLRAILCLDELCLAPIAQAEALLATLKRALWEGELTPDLGLPTFPDDQPNSGGGGR